MESFSPTPPPLAVELTPEHRMFERIKELDLAHRNRLRSTARLTLGLSFLRQAFRRLATPTRKSRAEPVPRPPGGLAVTLVGHATVMLTSASARIVTDPLLATFLGGLRRARAPGVTRADLADVTAILISHAHFDHLHPASLARLPRGAALIVPQGCKARVAHLGFHRVHEVASGDRVDLPGVEIHAVPARHDGSVAAGPLVRRHLPAIGYVIRSGGVTAYFAGDTGFFSGFAEIGARFRPEVALLPISGYEPESLRADHMSPLDALYAFEDLGARFLIPIAAGDFPLGYEGLAAPQRWLDELVVERNLGDKVRPLDPGHSLLITAPERRRTGNVERAP